MNLEIENFRGYIEEKFETVYLTIGDKLKYLQRDFDRQNEQSFETFWAKYNSVNANEIELLKSNMAK